MTKGLRRYILTIKNSVERYSEQIKERVPYHIFVVQVIKENAETKLAKLKAHDRIQLINEDQLFYLLLELVNSVNHCQVERVIYSMIKKVIRNVRTCI